MRVGDVGNPDAAKYGKPLDGIRVLAAEQMAALPFATQLLARLGAAFPGTVWVGGCKNWYTSKQPNPVLWPLPQEEHKGFFERVPLEDFDFTPTGQAD